MARLRLNKSQLSHEQAKLSQYRRFLPSLDLKRRQLMGERARAVQDLRAARARIDEVEAEVSTQLPMLANTQISLDGLLELTAVDLGEENVAGTRVPVLNGIKLESRPYSPFAKPQWVDEAVRLLKKAIEARLNLQVAEQRLERLDQAVAVITQRVNLFDKVLIPQTQTNIRRIRIYLNDEEMAAVVRSKISKRKHATDGL